MNHGFLGEPARRAERHHAIPRSEIRYALADFHHDARYLGARAKRELRLHLIFALHDQHVGKVETGGSNADAYARRTEYRRVDLFETQVLRRPERAAYERFHPTSISLLPLQHPQPQAAGAWWGLPNR